MDKLNQLLVGHPVMEFGAAFRAATLDSGVKVSQSKASIWLEGGVTPAGAGFVWGYGTITYRGIEHPFRLSGLSIANGDAANMSAAGSVMHLKKLSDFSGYYLASRVGSTGADSGPTTYLKNDRGVVIELIATDAGRRITVPIYAAQMRLKRKKTAASSDGVPPDATGGS